MKAMDKVSKAINMVKIGLYLIGAVAVTALVTKGKQEVVRGVFTPLFFERMMAVYSGILNVVIIAAIVYLVFILLKRLIQMRNESIAWKAWNKVFDLVQRYPTKIDRITELIKSGKSVEETEEIIKKEALIK